MGDRLTHAVRRMAGRDPAEDDRASTPLELLFDLTFVIAFGTASEELARLLAEGHPAAAIGGFCFATFAVAWAWVNFSWFASAYDTDDWLFRLTTMVQMVGVLVLALGLSDFFDSLVDGDRPDIAVMVLGYVVMRVAMLAQWLRAAHQDPDRSEVCRVMATTLAWAQAGWVGLLLLHLSVVATFGIIGVLILVEVAGPALAETRYGGTPWHPGHIAERYGLLVIIALGEGLLGTAASLRALVSEGWTVDIVVLGAGGVALTFGVWWTYFVIPSAPLIAAHRESSFGWGYGHIPLFGAVVAIGAGLHVAAYRLDDRSTLGPVATVLAVVVPLAVYTALLYALYALLSRSLDPFHLVLLGFSAGLLALAVALAAADLDLVWCLLVAAAVPWVTVVGYETVGYRHNAAVLASLDAEPGSSRPPV